MLVLFTFKPFQLFSEEHDVVQSGQVVKKISADVNVFKFPPVLIHVIVTNCEIQR